MKKKILVFLFFFFYFTSLVAQSTEYDFPAMRWTRNYGLKSNSVNDLAVDSRGVIWVSTTEGIYRHHGNIFENLNTIIENSLFDNPIDTYDLYIDDQDRMWMGTWENGLLMYDIKKKKLKHYEVLIDDKERLSNLRIYGLHMLNDSVFRFTSHTHGLIDYNIVRDNFSLIEVFTDSVKLEQLDGFQKMIRPVEIPGSGIVENWYCSLTGMIEYDVKLDSFIYYDDGDPLRIRKAMMDQDSLIWCVTYGQGLYSFDMKTKNFINYRCYEGEDWSHPCLSGATLEIYNDSTLILDSSDGLYYFNKSSHNFNRFYDILPNNLWSGTTNEMEWINGELWQASLSSTLYRHFKDDHGVKSVSIGSNIDEVYYDAKNNAYISTDQPNLITIHKEEESRKITVPYSVLDDAYVEGVTRDKSGNLWIATSYQVLLYDQVKNTFSLPFRDILHSIRQDLTFRDIGTHPDGGIWLVSHDGTIFTFNPTSLEYMFYGGTLAQSIPIDYNYRAHLEAFSNDGYTWLSSQEGFFGLSPNGQNHLFCKNIKDRKTNLPITLLSPSIGIGKDGKICFGSKTNEIYIIDKDSLDGGFADLFDLKDIIPNLSINDIEIDNNNVIWIATKMGLIKIVRESGSVELFGDAHRLSDLGKLELKDGMYPIALSANHFRIINPEKLKAFPGTPNIQLLSTELDSRAIKNNNGNSIETGQKIELGPNDNFTRIKFNDFNYVSQQPKTYAIKIEGFHDDWIDLNERTEFGFSGLPGGQSDIWVKSKLQFAREYSQPVRLLSVQVTPPLTRRKSFWAFCTFLLLLLFYLGYRYRLSQLKERQDLMIAFNKQLAETEMKALRAQMNPHFLFNVLNAIKLNVQKNEQENAIDFITDFAKLIRSVLQNSGKKRISLEEELQTLELYIKIERKRFSTSFDYEFIIDKKIDAGKITIPPMLLQPYVENAIWHGILHKSEGLGHIRINTYKVDDSIVIEITDNGIGREKANKLKLKSAQKNKSMGMQITKDRMAISNRVSSDHIEVEIIDLYGDNGQSIGTKVVIMLKFTG